MTYEACAITSHAKTIKHSVKITAASEEKPQEWRNGCPSYPLSIVNVGCSHLLRFHASCLCFCVCTRKLNSCKRINQYFAGLHISFLPVCSFLSITVFVVGSFSSYAIITWLEFPFCNLWRVLSFPKPQETCSPCWLGPVGYLGTEGVFV